MIKYNWLRSIFSHLQNNKSAGLPYRSSIILAIDFPLGKRNFITRQMTRAATKTS